MSEHARVGVLLQSLQQELEMNQFWSVATIEAEALMSQQPFCVDTLNFSQWLQFVFIPRMQALIDSDQALPRMKKGQGIEPMASEYFNNKLGGIGVLTLIRQLDEVLQN